MTKLAIPSAALAQHIALLGKTRSGKSSVARLLVEHLLDQKKPVGVVDPKGDWWGLKSSADGKQAGYPLVIFGGEHADVPINAHSGAHVAELVATGNRPYIIDLGGWMPGDRTQFWIDFASGMFRHSRGLRHLVIDEVHNFAPKGKILDVQAGEALHWSNRLASEGLGKGIHLIVASQRPQKVHNDLLTSCETLIAMRVLHPSDREAVTDWIKGCGDAALGATVLGSLAQMQRGEGWAWSPEIGFGPERIQFPMFRTYDSFKAREAKGARKLKGWATVDLDEVRQKLQAVVEEARANDPTELKREVAELRRKMTGLADPQRIIAWFREKDIKPANIAFTAGPERQMAVVIEGVMATKKGTGKPDAAALQRAREQGATEARKAMTAGLRHLGVAAEKLLKASRAARAAAQDQVAATAMTHNAAVEIVTEIGRLKIDSKRPIIAPEREPPAVVAFPDAAGRQPRYRPDPRPFGNVEQRILGALMELDAMGVSECPRVLVAFLAGYGHSNSKGFANAVSAASSAGLLCYPTQGKISITDAGRSQAPAVTPPASQAELIERIAKRLSGPAGRIVTTVAERHPDPVARDELARLVGYEHTNSKGFANSLSRCHALGFVVYPDRGHVGLADILLIGGQ